MTRRQFSPDWVEPPGATVASILAIQSIDVQKFAARASISSDVVARLISGDEVIDSELAERLAVHLGSTARFWMSREKCYRQQLTAAAETNQGDLRDWIRALPVADMVRFGWIKPESFRLRAEACLRFFGVPDLQSWDGRYSRLMEQVAFRTSNSFDSNPSSVVAWLRFGELEAQKIDCAQWNCDQFRQSMNEMRALTRVAAPSEFIPKLQAICARSGVALVVARAPKGCAASGSTRFLSAKKAVLMLSLRYRTDDHFWFSFFHEVGHLVLHGTNSFFVDGKGLVGSDREREADEFASESLIPESQSSLLESVGSDYRSVIRAARKLGISR
ncbi:MAG TPA: ImmA/IrrE family metallo-endopeptidase, partial [Rhodanobacter sp.]|nr:ImmA/IrrE family metallo-endopeptidase [Rhodanobacter sp.]